MENCVKKIINELDTLYSQKVTILIELFVKKYKLKEEDVQECIKLWNSTNGELSIKQTKKKTEKELCIQLTKEGKQCKNPQKDGQYCSQHRKKTTEVKTVDETCKAILSKGGQCTLKVKVNGLCKRHYTLEESKKKPETNVTTKTQPDTKKEQKKVDELEEEDE